MPFRQPLITLYEVQLHFAVAFQAAFDHLVAENLQARLSCTYLVKYYYDTQDPVYMKHVVK